MGGAIAALLGSKSPCVSCHRAVGCLHLAVSMHLRMCTDKQPRPVNNNNNPPTLLVMYQVIRPTLPWITDWCGSVASLHHSIVNVLNVLEMNVQVVLCVLVKADTSARAQLRCPAMLLIGNSATL